MHGANRPGHQLAAGHQRLRPPRLVIAAAEYANTHDFVAMPPEPTAMVDEWLDGVLSEHGNERVADIRTELQQTMDNNASVFRTEETLTQALSDVRALGSATTTSASTTRASGSTPTCSRRSNRLLLEMAEVTVVGALNRKESRGGTPARTSLTATTRTS